MTGTRPEAGQPTQEQVVPPDDAWAGIPPASRPDEREAALRSAAGLAVSQAPPELARDPWRQGFHVQPPVGLLNDPNGLVQHDGVFHLCYQWHPPAPVHGLKMWAHLTSTDLVHWVEHPPALVPSQPYESHGCYSGSAVVHEGAVHFLYTGNVRTEDGGRIPNQVVARLEPDGSVHKLAGNPVLGPFPGYTAHVRDPKVWREDDAYWMVLGAQTADRHGSALLLRSPDLIDWEVVGTLGGGADDPVGGYMWECPDVLRFPYGDVLVISAQEERDYGTGATQFVDQTDYAVGRLSLDPAGFERTTPFRRMDAGPDFYAPQSFLAEDGRRIVIGWLGMPDQPGQPGLARKHPSVANGWVHCLSVPREVRLVEGALAQQPVAELAALRGPAAESRGLRLDPGDPGSVPGVRGTRMELSATVRAGSGTRLVITLRDGPSCRPVRLEISPGFGEVTLDRTLLGTGEGGRWTGAFRAGGSVDVRVLLDSSSVEVFVDEGRCVLSARIYPQAGDDRITWSAEGGAAEVDLTAWPLTQGG
jgi:beta-fructofuranosidase